MSIPPLHRTPLYEQVAEILRQEILQKHRAGDKLQSEVQLADRFKVSVATMREVLTTLVREGLITRHVGSGTYVAKQANATHLAVLLDLDISHPGTSPFFLKVLQQARSRLEAAGHQVKLYTGRQDPTVVSSGLTCHEFIEDVTANQVSGVIVVFAIPHPAWIDLLEHRRIPLVGAGDPFEYRVAQDRPSFIRAAISLLLERGRRKIALMGWAGFAEATSNWRPSYADLFRQGMNEKGVPTNEVWIHRTKSPSIQGVGWEAFREIWRSGAVKPDGMIICDDLLFRDAATAILDMRIQVPRDLLIVTQSSEYSGILYPFPVMRIEYSPNDTAQLLVDLLLQRLKGVPVACKSVFLPGQIIVDEALDQFQRPQEQPQCKANLHETPV